MAGKNVCSFIYHCLDSFEMIDVFVSTISLLFLDTFPKLILHRLCLSDYRDCSLYNIMTQVIDSTTFVVFTSDLGGYSNPLTIDLGLRAWQVCR